MADDYNPPGAEQYSRMKKLKPSSIPNETVLRVREGAIGYRGTATAIKIAGEEVIILTRNVAQLNIVHNYLYPKDTLQARACYPVAMVALVDVTLDDEL